MAGKFAESFPRSYRELRSLHHPDKGGNADEFDAVQKAFEQSKNR